MKKIIARSILVFFHILIFVLVLEIFFRVGDKFQYSNRSGEVKGETFFQYHDRLGWAAIPNKKGIFHKFSGTIITTNSKGFRDKERAYDKAAWVTRVLILGDSFTWANGVRNDEIFTHLLEGMASDLEVINAGVPGYGTGQELILLQEEGFKYKPQIVLLMYYIDDLWDNIQPTHVKYYRPLYAMDENSGLKLTNVPVPMPDAVGVDAVTRAENVKKTLPRNYIVKEIDSFLLKHSYLYAKIKDKLKYILVRLGLKNMYTEYSADFYGWRLTERLIAEMNEACSQHDAKLLVMIIPAKLQLKAFSHNTSGPQRLLTGLLKEKNIPYVDLLPVFKDYEHKHPDTGLYLGDDMHWTNEGHKLIAEKIYEFLNVNMVRK